MFVMRSNDFEPEVATDKLQRLPVFCLFFILLHHHHISIFLLTWFVSPRKVCLILYVCKLEIEKGSCKQCHCVNWGMF